jgi:hypothetical protein
MTYLDKLQEPTIPQVEGGLDTIFSTSLGNNNVQFLNDIFLDR